MKLPSSLFYRVTDGKVYPESVTSQIRRARTAAEVSELLSGPLSVLAGAGTRRRWVRAAEARLATLRVEALRG